MMKYEQVVAWNTEAEELENKNPKEALEKAKKAYEISLQENFETEKARSLLRIGRCLWLMGSYHDAIEYLNKALEVSKTLKSGFYEVEVLRALGNVQSVLNIYDHAINFYAKALKIAQEDQLHSLEASLLNNIGGTYLDLGDLDLALIYLIEGLDRFKKLDVQYGQIICYLNLGEVYYKKKDLDKARDYTVKSLEFYKKIQDKIGYRHGLHLLGSIEKASQNDDQALALYEASLEVAIETSDYAGQIDNLLGISEIQLKQDHLEDGIDKLLQCLSISENIDGHTFGPTIYSRLARAYGKMMDHEKTMLYYKKFHDATLAVQTMRREEKLRSISFQIELEQSQQQTETYRELMQELKDRTEELANSYEQIQVVSEIGQSITATLDLKKSFNRIYENINKLMKSTVLGIGLYNKEEACIEFKLYKEKGIEMPPTKIPLTSTTSWAIWSFNNKKEILINDVEQEYSKYLKGRKTSIGNKMSSVIFYPLIVDDHIIGVVTVQCEEKYAYEQSALDTMKILASYIAIAINNAQKSEQLAEEVQIREKAQIELELLNEKLQRLSNLDGLTNIPNRRCFDQEFEAEWEKAIEKQTPTSILLIDVDKFKEYNDNYGHLEGDIVLKQVAKGIEKITNQFNGLAARYGGDEFIIFLKNTSLEQALKAKSAIQEEISSYAIKHEYSPIDQIITLSIGVASVIPTSEMKKERLIEQADEALYRLKGNGRT
jgi:diguanylate cyclase (GGDEF)-like protein